MGKNKHKNKKPFIDEDVSETEDDELIVPRQQISFEVEDEDNFPKDESGYAEDL